MANRTVWGHGVETDARGRSWWPRELKQEVVVRIIGGQILESVDL